MAFEKRLDRLMSNLLATYLSIKRELETCTPGSADSKDFMLETDFLVIKLVRMLYQHHGGMENRALRGELTFVDLGKCRTSWHYSLNLCKALSFLQV